MASKSFEINESGRKTIPYNALSPSACLSYLLHLVFPSFLSPELEKPIHFTSVVFCSREVHFGCPREAQQGSIINGGALPCGNIELEFIFVCFVSDISKVLKVPRGFKVNA